MLAEAPIRLYLHAPRKVQHGQFPWGVVFLFIAVFSHSRTYSVVLFVSDMHFGRADRHTTRCDEQALVDCLRAHYDTTQYLYLVGDVFDAYIEHQKYVPKGAVRLQAELARWVESGRSVIYLMGNHDPWHLDYMDRELGVRMIDGPWIAHHFGQQVYLAHGDAIASTHGWFGRWMRTVMRHKGAVAAYRTLIPADWGLAGAERVSRWLHGPTDPQVVNALGIHAQHVLHASNASAVVMGHSHQPVLQSYKDGVYANTGAWYETRTVVRFTGTRWTLMRWNGKRAVPIKSVHLHRSAC